jgi:hypothetical protein
VRRAAVSVLALAAVLVIGNVARAAPSPKQQLRDAATGTWSGASGTLEFREGRTLSFTGITSCYTPLDVGVVEIHQDCDPDVVEGRYTVRATGFDVAPAERPRRFLIAYVEDDVLHLAEGPAARLDRDREGTIEIGPSERLRVGDGRCRYSSTSADPIEARCRFVERGGRTILLYRGPDPFAVGTVGTNGLVYLPESRLLVAPELVERTYARAQA